MSDEKKDLVVDFPFDPEYDVEGKGERVLVTGASGFIAGHIVVLLMKRGYRVRGTVRNPNDEKLKQHFKKLVPDYKYDSIELVEGDLLKESGWDIAVQDCDYVIHAASPFLAESVKDEQILIKPAVQGTLSVMKAVAATKGKIKRVVLTSSFASIGYGYEKQKSSEKSKLGYKFSEADWSDIDHCSGYIKSKVLAEKAAWDYLATLPAEEKFELTAINPTLVQGPLFNDKHCASQVLVERILKGELPAVPKAGFGIVDVRDVALAHVRAMTNKNSAGQRYLLAIGDKAILMTEIAQILHKQYKPLGYKIPTMQAGYNLLWFISWFDSQVAAILDDVKVPKQFSTEKAQKELGIKFIGWEDSVLAMAKSLIDFGIVKKK